MQLVVVHCWWRIFLNFIYYWLTCRITNSWQGHCNSTWSQLLQAHKSLPHLIDTPDHVPGTTCTSPTLYKQCVGSLTYHRIYTCTVYVQGLWDGAYGLSSLISKKPRKSTHFANVFTKAALSAQLWKILSVSLAGGRTNGLPLSRA